MANSNLDIQTDTIIQTFQRQWGQLLRANQHLSEGERQRLWSRMMASVRNGSCSSGLDHQATVSTGPSNHPTLQIPAHNMNRTGSIQSTHSVRSAPADLLMTRSISGNSISSEIDAAPLGGPYGVLPQMEKSQSMMHWGATSNEEPFSVYSMQSSMDQTSSMGISNYDSSKLVAPAPSSTFDITCSLPTTIGSSWEPDLSQLEANALSPSGNALNEWPSPYEGSSGSTGTTTPTTTSSGELSTRSTVDNSEMSNHGSTSFRGTPSSFDVFPKSFDVFGFSDTAEKTLDAMPNAKHCFDLNESTSSQFPMSFVYEDVYSPIHFPVDASVPSVQTQSTAVEEMIRSTSSQSSLSARSEASTQSRSSQRRHETLVQSSRPLAPKDAKRTLAEITRQSSDQKVILVPAQDGSSKHVARITKAPACKPYTRPHHPKMLCPHNPNCRPEGFRGDHELRRHIESKHATVRKVWICVDASPNKTFLASCKHCKNKKTYNAYYNAAAHLRRAHFHPRKRGRKSRNDSERRGGKGGGNDPPMEFLKDWMKEIEVFSTDAIDSGDESNESCRELEGEATATMLSSSPSVTMSVDPTMPVLTARMGSSPFGTYPNIEHAMSHVSSYSGAEAMASDLPPANFDSFIYQPMRGSADNSSIDFGSLQQHLEVGYPDSFISM